MYELQNLFKIHILLLLSLILSYLLLVGEEYRENMHKSIVDLRRAVNDEIREKETIQTSANELRVMVKKAESERIDMNRQLQDSAQKNNG